MTGAACRRPGGTGAAAPAACALTGVPIRHPAVCRHCTRRCPHAGGRRVKKEEPR